MDDYKTKVLAYLQKLKPGSRISIITIAEVPEKFISAVKYLIDSKYSRDIWFNNDYTTLKKGKWF